MPSYADLLSNALAGYGNVMSGYQNALGSQRANQQNIVGGYSSLYNNVLGTISGIGESEAQKIEDAYAQQAGQATQDLTNRGLGNTTVSQSVSRGIGLDKAKAKIELANKLAGLKAGYMSNLGLAGLNYGNQANQQDTSLQLSGLGYQAGFQGQQGNWGMQGLGMQNQVGMQNTQLAAQASAQQAAQQAQWAALQAGFTQQQAMQASQQAFQAAMLQAQMTHQSDMLGAQMANQNQQQAAQQAAQNQLIPNPYYMPQGYGGGGIPGNQYLTGPGSTTNPWLGMGGEGFTPGLDINGQPINPGGGPANPTNPAIGIDAQGQPIPEFPGVPGNNPTNPQNPMDPANPANQWIGIDAQGQPIYGSKPTAFLPDGTPNPDYAQYINQQDWGNVQGAPGIGGATSQAELDQMYPSAPGTTPPPVGVPRPLNAPGQAGAVPPPGTLQILQYMAGQGRGGAASDSGGAVPPPGGLPGAGTSRPPPVNQSSLERPSPSAGTATRPVEQATGGGNDRSSILAWYQTHPRNPYGTARAPVNPAETWGNQGLLASDVAARIANGTWDQTKQIDPRDQQRLNLYTRSQPGGDISPQDVAMFYNSQGLPTPVSGGPEAGSPAAGSNPGLAASYGAAQSGSTGAPQPSGLPSPGPQLPPGVGDWARGQGQPQSPGQAWVTDPATGQWGPDQSVRSSGPGEERRVSTLPSSVPKDWGPARPGPNGGSIGGDTPRYIPGMSAVTSGYDQAEVEAYNKARGLPAGTLYQGMQMIGSGGPAAPPSPNPDDVALQNAIRPGDPRHAGSSTMAYNPGMYGGGQAAGKNMQVGAGNFGNPWSSTGVPTMSAIPGGGFGGGGGAGSAGYGGQPQGFPTKMGVGNFGNPGMVNGQYTMGPTQPGMASAYAGAAQGPGAQKAAIPGMNAPPGKMSYQGPGVANTYAAAGQGSGLQKAAIPGMNTPSAGTPYQGAGGGVPNPVYNENFGITPAMQQQAMAAYLGAGGSQWWNNAANPAGHYMEGAWVGPPGSNPSTNKRPNIPNQFGGQPQINYGWNAWPSYTGPNQKKG